MFKVLVRLLAYVISFVCLDQMFLMITGELKALKERVFPEQKATINESGEE